MSSPPHPLMHFGMAGWFHIRNMETAYYKPNASKDSTEWPPKYWKFAVTTAEGPDQCEAAFVDFRRFARIRLIDCPADDIRHVSPLKENGPDPVQDKDVVTEEWLSKKLGSKHVPVKALLLDQANISGIGNWVGDELLYNARIHPEQYSDTLSTAQIKQLHKSIHYVCDFAVDNLADHNKFPEEWLFRHRWQKGKKDSVSTLPNGSRFVFLTVGGRTSCVVPSVQKKTGPVAGDIKTKEEDTKSADVESPEVRGKSSNGKKDKGLESNGTTRKSKDKKTDAKAEGASKKQQTSKVKKEEEDTEVEESPGKAEPLAKSASNKKRKSTSASETNGVEKKAKKAVPSAAGGKRRSTRLSGGGN